MLNGLKLDVMYVDEAATFDMASLEEIKAILDKPCLICGRANKDHMVFWNPSENWYQRQMVYGSGLDTLEDCANLVKASDHYACIDNLEYLERLDEKRSRTS